MQQLFPPLSQDIRYILEDFPKILQKAWPIQYKHKQQLPYAIDELSSRLTAERSLLQQPYWSAPRLASAYVWYFLPWNIIRLTRLLQGLDLPEPTPMPTKKSGEALPRIFADMGSGPLSLPIALWLAKPQWRHIPLTILCTDMSPQPLSIGQKIFENLVGKDSPWRIVSRRTTVEGTPAEIHKTEGVPWLISAANVCNELKSRQGQSMDERLEELIEKVSSCFRAPDTRLLMIEPGTRLGGKTIVSLREAAQNYNLTSLSPCPHSQECPLQDSRTWCHFTFDVHGTPAWLMDLSIAAKLRKEALSLSFVLLQQENTAAEQNLSQGSSTMGRIISAPFRVPSISGFSRYVCCEQGLALVGRAESLPSGAFIHMQSPTENTRTDAKSGAFIVEHNERVEEPRYAEYRPSRAPRPLGSYNANENKKPSQAKPEKERKKKVIKPSKRNEKKFWEK